MKGVSIIICCYNSGDKLISTLQHLAQQKVLPEMPFEIIIVDNNCTDNSIKIATDTWASLNQPFPLSVVQQPKPGLSFAREIGMLNANFGYAVLCDDDNWLSNDYLAKVSSLFEKMPDVAIAGGVGEPVSEKPLPAWFKEVDGFGYAVGNENRHTGYVDSVYGAGMALRKDVFNSLTENMQFILSDRKANNLSSGGDIEICILIKNAGYKIYLDEELTFKHFLSSNRLNWKYYLQLRKSFGTAHAQLQMNNGSLFTGNKFMEGLSLMKFALLHLKYFLFPSFFKEAQCAKFEEELSRRKTVFSLKGKVHQT